MTSGAIRGLVLMTVLGGAGMFWWAREPAPATRNGRLTYVATARQLGVVGYRDPVGAISSDGAWIAYTEGRFLRVRPIDGGPVMEFPPAGTQIRQIAWLPHNAVLAEDPAATPRWWAYDLSTRLRRPLWPDRTTVGGKTQSGETRTAKVDALGQIAVAPDGRLAAVAYSAEGTELWIIDADGGAASVQLVKNPIAFPAWGTDGKVACVMSMRLSLPCGDAPMQTTPSLDLYGPPALSADGGHAFVSAGSPAGTLDLWDIDLSSRSASRVTNFSRDTYQPTVASDASLMFKVQSYRTQVADVDANGGAVRPLATFQSETPSWDPAGHAIAVTFGTWRRVMDDLKYPDIAQDIGVIDLDAALPLARPSSVVAQSPSEDQSMAWSPNRKWMAFHSHREMSDDVWLRPTDGHAPDRRISFLGRGAETGWPRWSPDGRAVLFTAMRRQDGRTVCFVIGLDPDTAEVTNAAAEIPLAGFDGGIWYAEWLPDGAHIAAAATMGPGRQAVLIAPRVGGAVRIVHEFASEHGYPGLGVSPDGREVAFVAPASDGFFQIFRLPLAGGAATQVTTDPSNKTQPSWSPDGRRIALTVWNYDAEFWIIR